MAQRAGKSQMPLDTISNCVKDSALCGFSVSVSVIKEKGRKERKEERARDLVN